MFEGTGEMSGEEMKIRLGREMILDFINKEHQRTVESAHFLDKERKINPDFHIEELKDEDFLMAYKIFTNDLEEKEFHAYKEKTVQEIRKNTSIRSRAIFIAAISNFVISIFYKKRSPKK